MTKRKLLLQGAYGAFVFAAGGAKQLEMQLIMLNGVLEDDTVEKFKERVVEVNQKIIDLATNTTSISDF